MALTETDILSRHVQSLGEASRACQKLGRNADPDYLALRGGDYAELCEALDNLEGSCRQLGHYRGDARWIRLSVVYARAKMAAQPKFVLQKWSWFGELKALFELGERRLDELNARTGRLSADPILPKNAESWLNFADPAIPHPRGRTVH